MPRYEVTLSASGQATITVEAADENAAIDQALRSTPGMTVEGGSCEWDVELVEELGA